MILITFLLLIIIIIAIIIIMIIVIRPPHHLLHDPGRRRLRVHPRPGQPVDLLPRQDHDQGGVQDLRAGEHARRAGGRGLPEPPGLLHAEQVHPPLLRRPRAGRVPAVHQAAGYYIMLYYSILYYYHYYY